MNRNEQSEVRAVSSIDWNFWRNTREVKVWEAVALSCNIDPQDEVLDPDDLIANHREVRKRVRLLLDHMSDRAFFTPGILDMGDPNLHGVRLPEFAAWWIDKFEPQSIPAQLAGMGEPLVFERLEKSRHQTGRYTLEEAAEYISKEGGERLDHILAKLVGSVKSRELQTYEPGRKAKMDYLFQDDGGFRTTGLRMKSGPSKVVRTFYEEVYWDDLNKWLTKNESKIECTFPPPDTVVASPVIVPQEVPKITTHKINNRTQVLTAEITEARKAAIDKDDATSVWAELVKMAEKKTGCLLEVIDNEIKYKMGDEVKMFKKRNLNERMKRATTR
jgi:hypothetical protein